MFEWTIDILESHLSDEGHEEEIEEAIEWLIKAGEAL